MKLTTKRILILFSLFLNIGFVTAATHHALFFNPDSRGHDLALRELKALDIPEPKRQTLLEEEQLFHQGLRSYFEERQALMHDRMLVLTTPGDPDVQRLEQLAQAELILTQRKTETTSRFLLQMRKEIGPEKTRQFIERMLAKRHKMPH
ncbi:MAG: hypothetical protein KKE73_10710 [Proteobacteria bacterium]|nr:hypothetical protein [Pseudomonadota bacterium]